jgi:hypothetical protein
MNVMDTLLNFLLNLAMVATLTVLVVGIISFAVHGEFYLKNANKLMRARVVLQGIALVIFAVITWMATMPPQP